MKSDSLQKSGALRLWEVFVDSYCEEGKWLLTQDNEENPCLAVSVQVKLGTAHFLKAKMYNLDDFLLQYLR